MLVHDAQDGGGGYGSWPRRLICAEGNAGRDIGGRCWSSSKVKVGEDGAMIRVVVGERCADEEWVVHDW